VENVFSIIRAKGAQRDNPDAGQFRAAFRQVMVDLVMVPSKSANCENDVDKFVCSLEQVSKQQVSPPPQAQPQSSVMDNVPWSVKSILSVCSLPPQDDSQGLSHQECNILAYIGGYIAHKIGKKVCSTCSEKIVAPVNKEDPNHAFIASKSYKSLLAPSKQLLGIIQLLELKYRNVIHSCIHKIHIKAILISELSQVKQLQNLACEKCHLQTLVLHLVINIRLHHSIKLINRNLKANKDRSNRKTLKFMHL
jgi:hypothetical protein